jgi:hypothetical protein
MLPLVRHCRRFYFAYLSRPASDRAIYRFLRKHRVRKILELGIGSGQRTLRMLELAAHEHAEAPISYTGIDLFESRSESDGPGLSLKAAHRQLKATGARVRLVPGDPYAALARTANELGEVDLIVVSADQDRPSLDRAWFYFPRILHAQTQIFLEERRGADGACELNVLNRDQIAERVGLTGPRRAAA